MFTIEVVVLPVADVDRALTFYRDGLGFVLDVDYSPTTDFRVVQMTPPGSACSIQFGVGVSTALPGSARGTYLVVEDLAAARAELVSRGIAVGEPKHKAAADGWIGGYEAGLDPGRGDYASFVDVADPDGNTWVIQERGFAVPRPASAA